MCLSALLCLPGLMALTACGSAPRPAPTPVALSLDVPAAIAEPCGRTDRPQPPPRGVLDTAKPEPLPNGLYSADDVTRLWLAHVGRGVWITLLSEFSIAQEGDISLCDERRAAAVDIIRNASGLKPDGR